MGESVVCLDERERASVLNCVCAYVWLKERARERDAESTDPTTATFVKYLVALCSDFFSELV